MTAANNPLDQAGLDLELLAELQQLEDHLRDLRALIVDCFRPGLSRGEVDALINGAFDPEEFPAEVRTWFAWHDGAHEDTGLRGVDPWLPYSKTLYSLAEAIEIRAETLPDYGPGTNEREGEIWEPSWLPLLGLGNLYLIADLAGGPNQPTPVHRVNHWPDVPWADIQEPSLTAMVRVWNGHLAAGDHHWDPDHGWTNFVYDPEHRGVMH